MLGELEDYYLHNYTKSCDATKFTYFDSPEFLRSTGRCIALVSVPVNLFGFYCILTRTSKSMRQFKWCLLNLQFWTLLIDSMHSFLGTPYFFLPALVGVSVGVLSDLGVSPTAQFIIGMFVLGGFLSSVVTLFENRHHHILPPTEPLRIGSPRVRVLLSAFNFFLGNTYVFVSTVYTDDQDRIKLRYLRTVLPCPHPAYFSRDTFAVKTGASTNWVTMTAQFCYNLIVAQMVFFISHTVWFLRKQRTNLSKRRLRMERTFFKASLVQVATPILVIFLPAVVMNYTTIAEIYNPALVNLCVLAIPFHGVVATTALISVNEPYRRFFKSVFTSSTRKTVSASVDLMPVSTSTSCAV